MSSVTQQLTMAFYSDAMNFFYVIEKAVYAMSISFIVVFAGCYLVIFIRFISLLNNEIWQTQGLVSMIPYFILQENDKVRENVCKHKGTK